MESHPGDAHIETHGDDAQSGTERTSGLQTDTASRHISSHSDVVVRTSTTETNKTPSSSGELTLWNKALNHVLNSNEDDVAVANIKDLLADRDSDPDMAAADMIGHLRSATMNEIVKYGEFRKWDVSLVPMEEVTRSFFHSTVRFLETLVPVGHILSQLDPVQADGLWNVVRLVSIFLNAKEILPGEISFGLIQVIILAFECHSYHKTLIEATDLPLEVQPEVLQELKNAIVKAYEKLLVFCGVAAQGFEPASYTYKLGVDTKEYIESLLDARKDLLGIIRICDENRHFPSLFQTAENLQLAVKVHEYIESKADMCCEQHGIPPLQKIYRAKDATHESSEVSPEPSCDENTRVELLTEIMDWARNPSGKRIFWLHGASGTGKSTIARTVAQKLSNEKMLGASFFFKQGRGDRGRATYFFPTLSVQLCPKMPYMFRRVAKWFRGNDRSFCKSHLENQFDNLISHPLAAVNDDDKEQEPRRLIVVIDALNECDGYTEDIVRFLSEMSIEREVELRVFITSRADDHINVGFDSIKEHYHAVNLDTLPENTTENDISTYLGYEMTRIRDAQNQNALSTEGLSISTWPKQEDLQLLAHALAPSFVSAATVCRFLEDSRVKNQAQTLKDILNHSMNTYDAKLAAAYGLVLDRLVAGKTDNQRAQVVNDFRDVVGPIVTLENPLSKSSLIEILQLDPQTLDDVLESLQPVLQVPCDGVSPVRTLHQSFGELLAEKHHGVPEDFWIDQKLVHQKLAIRCLSLLSDNLKEDMCNLQMSGKSRGDISSLPSEIRYASMLWIHHLKKGQIDVDDGHYAYIFLKNHFLQWLEVLGLMGRVSESIGLLEELRGRVSPTGGVNMLEFLYDAKQFITRFRSAINEAPLQLYSSALLFSPRKSIIRNLFEKPMDWITQKPVMESFWSPCRQILEGHDGNVTSVAFSADGRLIASGSRDNHVKVWDVATGELQKTLKGHDKNVTSVVFLSDGLVASGSDDNTVKIWNITTWELEKTLESHTGDVTSVSFPGSTGLVVSGSKDGTVKIWDIAGGVLQHTLHHNNPVLCLASTTDRKLTASASRDRTIKLWSSITGEQRLTLTGHKKRIHDLAFNVSGTLLASGSWDGTIKIWDTATGQLQNTVDFSGDYVHSVAFLGDTKLVATGSWYTQAVKVVDAATGTIDQTLDGHSEMPMSVCVSSDSKLIASSSYDGTVRLWDMTIETSENRLSTKHTGSMIRVAFSPDSTLVASGSHAGDTSVKIWDASSGMLQHRLEGHTDSVDALTFSSDSKLLASGSSDYRVKIWDLRNRTLLHTLEGHTRVVWSCAFSPDSKLLASSSLDTTVKVWDAANGTLLYTLEAGSTEGVFKVAFSPDNKLLGAASFDKTVTVWEAANGTLRHRLEDHTEVAGSVIFSPDSQLVISGSVGKTVHIWDATSGILQQSFEAIHRPRVFSFIENGSVLLLEPGSVRVPIVSKRRDNHNNAEPTLDTAGPKPWSRSRVVNQQQNSYSVCPSDNWIQRNGQNLLYLPLDFRTVQLPWDVSPSKKTVAFGIGTGRLFIIGFEH